MTYEVQNRHKILWDFVSHHRSEIPTLKKKQYFFSPFAIYYIKTKTRNKMNVTSV